MIVVGGVASAEAKCTVLSQIHGRRRRIRYDNAKLPRHDSSLLRMYLAGLEQENGGQEVWADVAGECLIRPS